MAATEYVYDTSPFCEARYGGLFRQDAAAASNGTSAEVGMFPEYGSAYSALFIAWVGLHMLLFNSHESALLKVIGGLIVANGIFSFGYHYTGYMSLKEADGLTMIDAVWLTAGLMFEEASESMDHAIHLGPDGGDKSTATAKRAEAENPMVGFGLSGCNPRRIFRTITWITVVTVPYLTTLIKKPPLRDEIGAEHAETIFYVLFSLPLVFTLGALVLSFICSREKELWARFMPKLSEALPSGRCCCISYAAVGVADSKAYGKRLRRSAIGHFVSGFTMAVVGVGCWIATEKMCDTSEALRLFPGHMLFHLLLAWGLLHMSIWPSLLRADNFGATPYMAKDLVLQGANYLPCGCAHVLLVPAYWYLTLFPAFIFKRNLSARTRRELSALDGNAKEMELAPLEV